ncbi:MAG: hypothetical protein ABJK20_06390 [Halieaceae bacterium]
MKVFSLPFVLLATLMLGACGTTDSQLESQGRSQAYIDGFHDGSKSGMEEAGNNFSQYVKDEERYQSEPDYRTGWDAGEAEGEKLEEEAENVGNAAATGMAAHSINKEVKKSTDMDKVARDAVKGVDTTGMDALGK